MLAGGGQLQVTPGRKQCCVQSYMQVCPPEHAINDWYQQMKCSNFVVMMRLADHKIKLQAHPREINVTNKRIN